MSRFRPCGHSLCNHCVMKRFCQHPKTSRFNCPCGSLCESVQLQCPASSSTRSTTRWRSELKQVLVEEPVWDPMLDPGRIFLESLLGMDAEESSNLIGSDGISLFVTYEISTESQASSGGGWVVASSCFKMPNGDAFYPSLIDEEMLLKLASRLHRPLMMLSQLPCTLPHLESQRTC
jgi:hypothetical protein